MSKELEPIQSSPLSLATGENKETTIQQTGQKNIYAQNLQNLNVNVETVIVSNLPTLTPSTKRIPEPTKPYYNLIINPDIKFPQSDISGSLPTDFAFIIPPSRTLTNYIDAEVKERFARLDDDILSEIYSFPTIFAHEHENYGHPSPEQLIYFGYIKAIKVRRNGIKIYPEFKYKFSQETLNNYLFELGIDGDHKFNEFNHTHWTIKKIDLVSELRELGFSI